MTGLTTLTKQLKRLEEEVLYITTRPEKSSVEPAVFQRELGKVGERFTAVEKLLKQLESKEIEIPNVDEKLKQLRQDIITMLVNHSGGGNANRNIQISGVNVLRPFTDINLLPGPNVTISYTANQLTKYTDITISSSGSGGGGITRSVNTVAVNTLAGAAPGIDYVYLASGNITITLPTTVGNSNLYTIKNIGAGTVIVNTTGGETIDGGPTVTMPVQFTSVDLISNNSGNWDVT